MADFCLQCANDLFGSEDAPVKSDFYGLLSEEDFYKGYLLPVLCEGCGYIYVDSQGKRSKFKTYDSDETDKKQTGRSSGVDSPHLRGL